MVWRIIIFAAIAVFIYIGVRRIWADWTGQVKKQDAEELARRRQRDLSERQRPDVIDLTRDDDGTFRPGDKNNRR